MISGFREFLIKQNFLALALAVVIGTAAAKVVAALVADLIMPIVGLVLPGGSWRTARIVLERSVVDGEPVENALLLGDMLGAVLDFLIVALVVYAIMRALVKSPPPPDTRACPECTEAIPAAARRCKHCGAQVGTAPARA
jgi:large conductance mechanosensitive channel